MDPPSSDPVPHWSTLLSTKLNVNLMQILYVFLDVVLHLGHPLPVSSVIEHCRESRNIFVVLWSTEEHEIERIQWRVFRQFLKVTQLLFFYYFFIVFDPSLTLLVFLRLEVQKELLYIFGSSKFMEDLKTRLHDTVFDFSDSQVGRWQCQQDIEATVILFQVR